MTSSEADSTQTLHRLIDSQRYHFSDPGSDSTGSTKIVESGRSYEAFEVELTEILAKTLEVNETATRIVKVPIPGPGDAQFDFVRVPGFSKSRIKTDRKETEFLTYPPPGTTNFPPNEMPFFEVRPAHRLWRSSGAHDQPWLVGVAIENSPDAIGFQIQEDGSSLARISGPLPNLRTLEIFSHVHVVDDVEDPSDADLLNQPDAAIDFAVGRVLSPQRLKPNTDYLFLLLPVFDADRRKSPAVSVDLAAADRIFSWDGDGGGTEVEVVPFDVVSFHTGPAGDFEQLLREMKPQLPPPGFGIKEYSLATPGPWLLPPEPAINQSDSSEAPDDAVEDKEDNIPTEIMFGALRSVGTLDPKPSERLLSFAQRMAVLLKTSAAEQLIGPPYYGRSFVDAGTDFFADEHGPIDEAALLNHYSTTLNLNPGYRIAASLAFQLVSARRHKIVEVFLKALRTLHEVRLDLRRHLRASEFADRIVDKHLFALPLDERLRALAPMHAKFSTEGGNIRKQLIETNAANPLLQSSAFSKTLSNKKQKALQLAHTAFSLSHEQTGTFGFEPVDFGRYWSTVRPSSELNYEVGTHLASASDFERQLKLDLSASSNPTTSFEEVRPPQVRGGQPRRGRAALEARRRLSPQPDTEEAPKIAELASKLRARLKPQLTLAKSFGRKWSMTGESLSSIQEKLASARPDLKFAVAELLVDFNREAFLPGVGELPNNSIVALQTNPRFVEAFMVGLNQAVIAAAHAQRIEVLPTQQSICHHFWDAGRPDIKEIDSWGDSTLGANAAYDSVGTGATKENLVLVLRGEFVRRFPTASVVLVAEKTNVTEIRPIFEGRIGEDIRFVGFPVAAEAAANYTLRISEDVGRPRFGLDAEAPETFSCWKDLSWEHIKDDVVFLPAFTGQPALDEEGQANRLPFDAIFRRNKNFEDDSPEKTDYRKYANAEAGLVPNALNPTLTWGESPSQTAWILMQQPYRRHLALSAMVKKLGISPDSEALNEG